MDGTQAVTVRLAGADDAVAVLDLLRQLAAFEGAADGVRLTEESFRRDGNGSRFFALLAEQHGQAVGLAILFPTYSSWAAAPALMVHDLFVAESARGLGLGRALLAAAAAEAQQRGCCRLDVNVLAWNSPARQFYEKLGFVPLTDWVPHRLAGEALSALADRAASSQPLPS